MGFSHVYGAYAVLLGGFLAASAIFCLEFAAAAAAARNRNRKPLEREDENINLDRWKYGEGKE